MVSSDLILCAWSGVHARILAPKDVRFLRYPEHVPQYDADASTVILYPSKVGAHDSPTLHATVYAEDVACDICNLQDAKTLESLPVQQFLKIQRVLLIDTRWKKSSAVLRCDTT